MSYTILYDKQFVKLPGPVYAPLILGGSNNCYDMHGGRSRDWDHAAYLTGGRLTASAEEMMAAVEEEIQERKDGCATSEYDREQGYTPEKVEAQYGWFIGLSIGGKGTSRTSAQDYRNFVRTGIKKAKTLEELADMGLQVQFYVYTGYGTTYAPEPPPSVPLLAGSDFQRERERWEEWARSAVRLHEGKPQGDPPKPRLKFCNGDWRTVSQILKNARAKQRPERQRQTYEQNHFYTLKNAHGYLRRYTRRGYTYAYNPSSGKRHPTERAALQHKARLLRSGVYDAQTWEVQRHETNHPVTFTG